MRVIDVTVTKSVADFTKADKRARFNASSATVNRIVACSLVAWRRDNHADLRLPHRLPRLGVCLLCDWRDWPYMEHSVVLAGVRFAVAASAHQSRGAVLHRGRHRGHRHHQGIRAAIVKSVRFTSDYYHPTTSIRSHVPIVLKCITRVTFTIRKPRNLFSLSCLG